MRFYSQTRRCRVMMTILWIALAMFWISMSYGSRHAYMHYIWTFTCVVQFANLWAYWEVSERELSSHSLGLVKRFQLASVERVGPPQTRNKLLAKTLQVDCRDRRSLFIKVAEKQQFSTALEQAVALHPQHRSTNGPLGLSL